MIPSGCKYCQFWRLCREFKWHRTCPDYKAGEKRETSVEKSLKTFPGKSAEAGAGNDGVFRWD